MVKCKFTYGPLLLLGTIAFAIIPAMLARMYAVKPQDLMILMEEQLRYYILTNNRLDPNLTIDQLIALRFVPDGN